MVLNFDSATAYPDARELLNPPETFDWSYVSSTYLAGFVNYVNHHAAWLFRGYYTDLSWTKLENLWHGAISNGGHTPLAKYPGRICLLGESEAYHWMFLFDPDVSDCRIARAACKEGFDTESSYEEFEWERLGMHADRDEWIDYWRDEFQELDMKEFNFDGSNGWITY